VRIRVYDVQGHEVARLHDGALDAGTHRITWAGATRGGRAAAPGVYLVRADGGGESSVMRVLRIR
jgi:flagellar hook assembly protein FlgD